MAGISFDRITKAFADTVAVDDVSLDVADGEFLVLLGPSGCGKSTLLRMLAGLERPTSGDVSIGGEVVTDVDARHRDIAMVFQSYALYPHMTVAKNIESPLVGRRSESVSRQKRVEMVQEVAAMLGLAELLDRKPGQLSGGQRQRVALARAIVRSPSVFLMDEPLSNLDAKLRAQTRADIVALHRRLATTFVYVTHDQVEAMTMASRIAILDEGRLQQVDDPRAVYREPANVFVARFIGSPAMNILPATVASDGARLLADVGGERLVLDHRWTGIADGQPVLLGVRPEHLTISDRGLPATVVAAEWLGHEQILQLDVGGTAVLVRDVGDGPLPAAGTSLHLRAEPDDLHLFHVDSGERVEST